MVVIDMKFNLAPASYIRPLKMRFISLHQNQNKSITSSVNTTKISIVVLDIILHLQIKIHCNNNLKVVNYYINNN